MRTFSSYGRKPLDIKRARDLPIAQVDFARVNRCSAPKIFVTATSVRTGRAKIFAQPQLSPDSIMASACLPFMFEV